MQGWKRLSSRTLKEWFRVHRPQYYAASEMADRFWQPKYFPFEIYSQEKLREKVDYMHQNPVARGLVARPEDYRWSSARWWLQSRSVGVPLEWID